MINILLLRYTHTLIVFDVVVLTIFLATCDSYWKELNRMHDQPAAVQ